jgi:hypothetical protein
MRKKLLISFSLLTLLLGAPLETFPEVVGEERVKIWLEERDRLVHEVLYRWFRGELTLDELYNRYLPEVLYREGLIHAVRVDDPEFLKKNLIRCSENEGLSAGGDFDLKDVPCLFLEFLLGFDILDPLKNYKGGVCGNGK